ncbi:MAG: pantetheine-phosphate adenylyltransferase [Flavobacteriales bacterium]
MSKKIAVFPGSFSPFTKGHESIVLRGLSIFDEIIVSIGINSSKNDYFSIHERVDWIKNTFSEFDKVRVEKYEGLTTDFCKKVNAKYILRGLRNPNDFEYEKGIAQMNQSLCSDIETVFMITEPKFAHISSTLVRDIIKNGGDVSPFLPEKIDI